MAKDRALFDAANSKGIVTFFYLRALFKRNEKLYFPVLLTFGHLEKSEKFLSINNTIHFYLKNRKTFKEVKGSRSEGEKKLNIVVAISIVVIVLASGGIVSDGGLIQTSNVSGNGSSISEYIDDAPYIEAAHFSLGRTEKVYNHAHLLQRNR
jgi:hypothetical protein